jgi:hypothetical protein
MWVKEDLLHKEGELEEEMGPGRGCGLEKKNIP